jgi:diaminopimelate decarboxylase
VGGICETGDLFAADRPMPKDLNEGDLVAILSAGAYGFSMAGRYNSRPMVAEVLVSGKTAKLIRKRETLDDLTKHERS